MVLAELSRRGEGSRVPPTSQAFCFWITGLVIAALSGAIAVVYTIQFHH
jgi:hypothetical protein